MFFRILFFLVVFLPNSMVAQSGCTDEQALNYNNAAVENDGSCLYPFTAYDLPVLADLPAALQESSGLEWINGKLYSHSDEGPGRLYEVNPLTGEIVRSVSILGGPENLDWEDLAESEDYLFIGEFGNNSGNRTDLKVYRMAKGDLEGSAAFVDVIAFAYADQSNFNHQPNQHNFDCEAMIYHGDSLHLFSKNWVDEKTRHYVLPAEPGSHLISAKDSFDVEGYITGADIGEEGVIALLGRTEPGTLFSWLLFDYPVGHFFAGNKRRIFLGEEKDKGQAEGIVFTGGGEAYISSEEKNNVPARLYGFSTATWTGVSVATQNLPLSSPLFIATPNPFTQNLHLQFQTAETPTIKLYNTLGQVLFTQNNLPSSYDFTTTISTTDLLPGCYFLEAQTSAFRQIKKLVKK